MGINRRSFMELLAKGGCAMTALGSGVIHLTRHFSFQRVRYAITENFFPGRSKDLRREDVEKPSHWLG